MKQLSIRLPDELLKALHMKAAEETLKRGERLSVNTLSVEILAKAVGLTDKRKK